MNKILITIIIALCALSASGCVRLTGGAGYWHTGEEGQPQSKQVGFDTDNIVNPGKAPGKITF